MRYEPIPRMQVRRPSICSEPIVSMLIVVRQWGEEDGTHNEDPSPARQPSQSVHLHETVGKNTTEAGCHATNEVESCVTLLQLVPRVPGTEQVDATGVESCLQRTEDEPETRHGGPTG